VRVPACLVVVGVVLCGLVASAAPEPATEAGENSTQTKISSLTVFPIYAFERPSADVGQVVGLMLEKKGLRNVALAKTTFAIPAGSSLEDVAAHFGAWVREHPIATEHALYGEFAGTRATGVQMVRGIIVDQKGTRVWASSQKPGDETFDSVKPSNIMTCCIFLSKCVLPLLVLKPWEEGEEPGPMERLWAQKTGQPTRAETTALGKKREILKKAGATARITVYPLRIGKKVDAEGAAALVKMINESKLCVAVAAPSGPWIDVKASRNQTKTLWDMARKFRDHVRKNPPETTYALYADYVLDSESGRVMAVHFAICDAGGEWVAVDLQGKFQDDFKSVAPVHVEGCNRLALKCLEHYLR
jgi:hypothetical protein